MEQALPQILLLLGTAVAVVVVFQRLQIPSILGYLLVGIIVGPYTTGPVLDVEPIRSLAEFGIVFLLFSIGLTFSPKQIQALKGRVLGLGTAQVALTTASVAILLWSFGLPNAAAFVVGAVFAQSSTTIISRQLAEQREEGTEHGRLATAMSVFQDVTAVPFVVLIPALGAGSGAFAGPLLWAVLKGGVAFVLVLYLSRWILHPLFHLVAERRSPELFTLTVLFVALGAGWATHSLGLSMPFGGFLAGMMLAETVFKHQVEAAIRPFRDVLLGLFFVGVGMLFDPAALVADWYWAVGGAAMLLGVKSLLVALLVRGSGLDFVTAWRTGLVLAVGGEFGFALLALGLGSNVLDPQLGQIALTSVLLAMTTAPFLIRYNYNIAQFLVRTPGDGVPDLGPTIDEEVGELSGHVIICGYGRIGQSMGHFLEEEDIRYVALDLDVDTVQKARVAGEPVFYGDGGDRHVLEAVGLDKARLVVITHADIEGSLQILRLLKDLRPDVPVMVRTRDDTNVQILRDAGASEVVPESLEAGLMIASQALLLLDVPLSRVVRRIRDQRAGRYRLLREFSLEEEAMDSPADTGDRLLPISVPEHSDSVKRTISDLDLEGVVVTALVRQGKRQLMPSGETVLEGGDVLVLFGATNDLRAARNKLSARPRRKTVKAEKR